jgi:hypothetical protein
MRLLTPFVALGATVGPGEGHSVGSDGYRRTMLVLGFAVPVAVDASIFAWEKPVARGPSVAYLSARVAADGGIATIAGSF